MISIALLYALAALWLVGRFVGSSGRDRFLRLSDERARSVHQQLAPRRIRVLVGLVVAQNVTYAAISLSDRSWVDAGSGTTGVVAAVIALALTPRAQAQVVDGLAARGLEPLPSDSAFVAREPSARRRRRTRQFGITTAVLFVGATTVSVLSEVSDATWVVVLIATAWSATLLSGFALLWSTAWRYGDEQPVDSLDSDQVGSDLADDRDAVG